VPQVRREANKNRRLHLVDLSRFKQTAARVLAADHPLNLILKGIPDQIPASELAIRLDDWLPLIGV
jgi:hypothetical protein